MSLRPPNFARIALTIGLALLICLIAAGCAPPATQHLDATALPVESTRAIDVAHFNVRIVAAHAAGEDWPPDALLVVQRFITADAQAADIVYRWLDIRLEGARGESPRQTTATVVEDGYLDDSVRGSWRRLELIRTSNGYWLLSEGEQAWRCQRGHHLRSYSAAPCP